MRRAAATTVARMVRNAAMRAEAVCGHLCNAHHVLLVAVVCRNAKYHHRRGIGVPQSNGDGVQIRRRTPNFTSCVPRRGDRRHHLDLANGDVIVVVFDRHKLTRCTT